LLLLGGSGSGKSSVLKAGVLPQLECKRSHWIVFPTFRPERAPLTNFVKTLAEKSGRPQAWRELRGQLVGPEPLLLLKEITDDVQLATARGATVLIPIDQFEETFTIANPEERDRFINLPHEIIRPKHRLPYLVIATARSDVLECLPKRSIPEYREAIDST